LALTACDMSRIQIREVTSEEAPPGRFQLRSAMSYAAPAKPAGAA
jgi:hypothetical protein